MVSVSFSSVSLLLNSMILSFVLFSSVIVMAFTGQAFAASWVFSIISCEITWDRPLSLKSKFYGAIAIQAPQPIHVFSFTLIIFIPPLDII